MKRSEPRIDKSAYDANYKMDFNYLPMSGTSLNTDLISFEYEFQQYPQVASPPEEENAKFAELASATPTSSGMNHQGSSEIYSSQEQRQILAIKQELLAEEPEMMEMKDILLRMGVEGTLGGGSTTCNNNDLMDPLFTDDFHATDASCHPHHHQQTQGDVCQQVITPMGRSATPYSPPPYNLYNMSPVSPASSVTSSLPPATPNPCHTPHLVQHQQQSELFTYSSIQHCGSPGSPAYHQQSRSSPSPAHLPDVKKSLQTRIREKRRASGLEDVTIEYPEPQPDVLTAKDHDRRERRRASNRAAAKKCRKKKKVPTATLR